MSQISVEELKGQCISRTNDLEVYLGECLKGWHKEYCLDLLQSLEGALCSIEEEDINR